ncbi:MAG: DUF559 domain-containing protein [Microbacterium sp.]|nr:DUF559 domain-containing protein [Microbacterium sp.]
MRTRHLRTRGLTERQVRAAVGEGRLVRLRAGAFCPAGTDQSCIEAGRLRGRLTCVSELRRLGVFVRDVQTLHVHIERTAARLPDIHVRHRVHRDVLRRRPHPEALSVEVLDALVHAVLCQDPRASVATIDSALHLNAIHRDDLDELFAALPRRYRRLRGLLDSRAESGPESLMRLILRSLGCSFEVQVPIEGVGRVDFLVEGWLIIECDSREHHSSWDEQRRDRRRDQAAASLGYATYRPIAEDIMWRPELVRAAVFGLRSTR